MKNLRLLVLGAVGFAISFTGFFLRINYTLASMIVMGIGAVVLFAFYIITFLQVIRSKEIPVKRKVFWIIAILCVPIVANLIYIFVNDALTSSQKSAAWQNPPS